MNRLRRLSDPASLSNLLAGAHGSLVAVSFLSGGRTYSALVPSAELWISVKDILVFEGYEMLDGFRLGHLGRDALVVDAGANVGLYSLKAAPLVSRVLAIEPSAANRELLTRNLVANGVENVETRASALWYTKETLGMVEAGSSSHVTRGRGDLQVPTLALDELVSECGRVDLLKMDVEGAELEILLGSELPTLRRIDRLVAEVHLYEASRREQFLKLIERLRKADMKVSIFSGPVQGLGDIIAKPVTCPLKKCNGRSAPLYRAFISSSYLYRKLSAGRKNEPVLLLYAYRN